MKNSLAGTLAKAAALGLAAVACELARSVVGEDSKPESSNNSAPEEVKLGFLSLTYVLPELKKVQVELEGCTALLHNKKILKGETIASDDYRRFFHRVALPVLTAVDAKGVNPDLETLHRASIYVRQADKALSEKIEEFVSDVQNAQIFLRTTGEFTGNLDMGRPVSEYTMGHMLYVDMSTADLNELFKEGQGILADMVETYPELELYLQQVDQAIRVDEGAIIGRYTRALV
ncbi:MAG TPA: hypothetical protein PKI93_04325 [Alphaproteobacteria bacterium]|nr:hypothetical protein [Alphaproteobacteria bacterium]HNS44080.1 hypothetical protein [Alphaproteobacteria bacterium]